MPKLPNWLCDGLINPLLRKQTIQLSDIVWYKEEEKDELFDCTGQFKVAALILADLQSQGKDSAESISKSWSSSHGDAMSVMKDVLQEEEITELKENFIEEHVDEAHREFVLSNLGLE